MPDTPSTHSWPRFWRVHWDEKEDRHSAWFQATRRNASAPNEGQEVVEAEAYDALVEQLEAALRGFVEQFETMDKVARLLWEYYLLPMSAENKRFVRSVLEPEGSNPAKRPT